MNNFKQPNFIDKSIEIRYENNSVSIYGNKEGLKILSDLLLNLIDNPGQGHIHLENECFGKLSDDSIETTIAIFK